MVAAVDNSAISLELLELLECVWCETDLVGDNYTCVAWELEGSTAEGFESVLETSRCCTDCHDLGVVVSTSNEAFWLTESVSHTCLKSIGTSCGKHLVDTKNVEWVEVDLDVIAILAHCLHHVSVRADTRCFEGFRGNAFVLEEDKAAADWKILSMSCLCACFVTDDTWIWDTTAEARLWEWLVTDVALAASWTTTH